jgi:hypothetical protein
MAAQILKIGIHSNPYLKDSFPALVAFFGPAPCQNNRSWIGGFTKRLASMFSGCLTGQAAV